MSESSDQSHQLGDSFSEDEVLSLEWMQQAYQAGQLPEQVEFVEERNRLDFARWLYETGQLNEDGSITPKEQSEGNQ